MVIPALLVIAGMVLVGCGGDSSSNGGPPPNPTDIGWSLSQDGEEDEDGLGTKTTTEITITLDEDAVLTGNGVVTLSTGNVTQGAISGSGKVWKVKVTNVNPGMVSVTINKAGVVAGPKSIRVIKEGELPPITYDVAANGKPGEETSTKIIFDFSEDVAGLVKGDITITPNGAVTLGDLTQDSEDASIWELALTDVAEEAIVTVKITKAGIDAGNQQVAVYKQAFNPDLYDITVIPTTGGTAADPAIGKGNIQGDDFYDIKYSKEDSELWFTVQLNSGVTGSWGPFGWVGKGSVKDPDGKFDLAVPTATADGATVIVKINVADLIDYLGDDADFIFVNVWNAKVLKCELVETKEGTRPTQPDRFTVSFDLDGGTYDGEDTIDDVKVEDGRALKSKFPSLNPLKTDFTFTGWADSAGNDYDATTPITANVELIAQYTAGGPPEFTVSFAGLAGADPSSITSIQVIDGQPAGNAFPANPRKAGYWFTGWKDAQDNVYTSTTPITAAVELIAQWTLNTMPAVTSEGSRPGYKKVDVAIYTDGGSAAIPENGQGNIEGDSLAALKSADADSILLLYLYVPTSIEQTDQPNRNGWGLGYVGNAEFKAPNPCTNGVTFHVSVSLASITDLATATYLFVRLDNQALLQRVELWEIDPDAGGLTWELTGGTIGESKQEQITWTQDTFKEALLEGAKYLVLEVEGTGDNANGFSGFQIIMQGAGLGWSDGQSDPNGWTSFNRGNDASFIVIELEKLKGFTTFLGIMEADGWGQLIIKYYGGNADCIEEGGLGLQKAYLTTTELLPAPGDASIVKNGDPEVVYGYIAKGLVFGQ